MNHLIIVIAYGNANKTKYTYLIRFPFFSLFLSVASSHSNRLQTVGDSVVAPASRADTSRKQLHYGESITFQQAEQAWQRNGGREAERLHYSDAQKSIRKHLSYHRRRWLPQIFVKCYCPLMHSPYTYLILPIANEWVGSRYGKLSRSDKNQIASYNRNRNNNNEARVPLCLLFTQINMIWKSRRATKIGRSTRGEQQNITQCATADCSVRAHWRNERMQETTECHIIILIIIDRCRR